MSKRKDRKESFPSKLLSKTRKKHCRKEWTESKGKVKSQKWQLVKTKIKMKYNSELVSKYIGSGMDSLRKRWITK